MAIWPRVMLEPGLKLSLIHIFGASGATYGYANTYFTVYLCGTVFNLLALGLNQFIICQGYARKGMISVMLGAALDVYKRQLHSKSVL